VESFGSRLRDELLAVEAFSSLLEARVLVEDWRSSTTPSDPTAPWATGPSPVRLNPRPPTNPHFHSGWTTNRGPVRLVFAMSFVDVVSIEYLDFV
jgi:hypothetical protein